MKTQILLPTPQNIKLCAEAILQNKIICYKTDTIYGIAANPFSDLAVTKIFKAKQRAENKPIILLASKDFNLESLVFINDKTRQVISKYWPGSLTIIFKLKSNNLAKQITSGNDTVAIRVPDDEVCNTLCFLSGGLITSTSANISGREVKTDASEILNEFGFDEFEFILDGGKTQNLVPSTIIDATNDELKIIRQGKVFIEL